MQLPPIAATTIGSFPRPSWLAATERSRVNFRLEGDALKEAQDDATSLNMRTQAQIGLDLLTDGEQRRTGPVLSTTFWRPSTVLTLQMKLSKPSIGAARLSARCLVL